MAVNFEIEGMIEPVLEPFPGIGVPGRRSLVVHIR
jgi:hypothetical protein